MINTSGYVKGPRKKTSQGTRHKRIKKSSMNKSRKRSFKGLAVSIEDQANQIRMLLAQQGNHEVQIAEYRQIIKELSKKLENYEKLYGTVFKPARSK